MSAFRTPFRLFLYFGCDEHCAHVRRHGTRKHAPTARSALWKRRYTYEPARATYMRTDRACLSSYPQVVVEGGGHTICGTWGRRGARRGCGWGSGAGTIADHSCGDATLKALEHRCIYATFGAKHYHTSHPFHSGGPFTKFTSLATCPVAHLPLPVRGPRAKAWCLLIHAEASLSLSLPVRCAPRPGPGRYYFPPHTSPCKLSMLELNNIL